MDSSRVIAVIAQQLGISVENIDETTSFSELGADSLDLFQIISELEDEFDVEFDNEEAEKIKTVGNAVQYIKSALE